MSFAALPAAAAWRHLGARTGFEVVYFRTDPDGVQVDGWTTALEDGDTFAVRYRIDLDAGWVTRRATVTARSADAERTTTLRADGAGRWTVDGEPSPRLDGCFDVDLEASAFTNALPVHRLALAGGETADAPAAYVRALEARAERLEQTYTRVARDGSHDYDYAAPAFDFTCRLRYDASGLVLAYPGIAERAG